MRLKPTIYEADAYWQLTTETRDSLQGLHVHHHGWFFEGGRWQEAVISKEFMPADAMLLVAEAERILKSHGWPVVYSEMAIQDGSFICTVVFRPGTLRSRAGSARASALQMLRLCEERAGRIPPIREARTIAESDSPKTLKED